MHHHHGVEGPYYLQITSLQGRVKFQDVYASVRKVKCKSRRFGSPADAFCFSALNTTG
jgi:hypothetical protein